MWHSNIGLVMNKLSTENWEWFFYKDIFKIYKGERLTKENRTKGDIPYISSSSVNNGIDDFIGNGITSKAPFFSIACYGSIGYTFYQNKHSWVSDNCNFFHLKDYKLNKYIGVFICTLMKKELYRYSYGVTAKVSRLENMKIKLPINSKKKPDWQFMEDYIKDLYKNKILKTPCNYFI